MQIADKTSVGPRSPLSPGPSPARGEGSISLFTLLFAWLATAGAAQPVQPAEVGRDRPLTSTWLCDNGRNVLINAHPSRRATRAWLTYAGTRVEVSRLRDEPGIGFAARDGKVNWRESGDEATLTFEGLLDAPLRCRREAKSRR